MPDSSKKRLAEFRNYYTIYALKEISNNDPVFEEQFLTNSAIIKEWPGSKLQEVESINDGRYWVKFVLKPRETKTIVTGANYLYPLPLQHNNSTSCFGDIIESTDEWMTCYPNSSDYIDNMTILIESDGIDLNLPPESKYRKNPNGTLIKEEGSCKVYSRNRNCTLVAKWTRLKPGECVGFKINWSKPI
jgi:hypothetical protein